MLSLKGNAAGSRKGKGKGKGKRGKGKGKREKGTLLKVVIEICGFFCWTKNKKGWWITKSSWQLLLVSLLNHPSIQRIYYDMKRKCETRRKARRLLFRKAENKPRTGERLGWNGFLLILVRFVLGLFSSFLNFACVSKVKNKNKNKNKNKSKAKQSKAKQSKAKQSKAKQSKTKQ